MSAMGWNRLGQNSKYKGWIRGRGAKKEMLCYVEYNGEDSLAFSYGFDLARKRLPRSFAEAVAADHGGFFGRVLLNGFDSFSRPPRIRETVE
jgi:hypothetical protein